METLLPAGETLLGKCAIRVSRDSVEWAEGDDTLVRMLQNKSNFEVCIEAFQNSLPSPTASWEQC